MADLDGRIAFITGAGKGQGRAHAVELARAGADVIVTDVCALYPDVVRYSASTWEDLEETARLVTKEGRRSLAVKADARDRAALQAAVDQGVAEFGGLDIVVGNAGVMTVHESSLDIDDATYDFVVDTNMKSAWNTVVTTAPTLIKQARGGSIILTSSDAGLRGFINYAHYTASKHGVVGVMRSFANELGQWGIRVNTVHPTGVNSAGMGSMGTDPFLQELWSNPLTAASGFNILPNLDEPITGERNPIPLLEPEVISHTVVFLASDEARYITGVTLPVDAGNSNKP